MSLQSKTVRWAMCPPRFFGVEYVINPWMEGHIGQARKEVANQQWQALYDILSSRVNVSLISPMPGLPDMPFTANAGLVLGDVFVPSIFRFPQRRGEEAYFTEWFRQQGFRIAELSGEGSFEGEGDALFQPGERLLWAGYGVRSSLEVQRQLCEILDVEVVSLRLVDQRFYHLDTCFAPLPGGRVVYYPAAFDSASLALLHARIPEEKRLVVGDEDAANFSCNAIVVDDVYICNQATPALRKQLATWGLEVVVTPLSEFMLAGGAAKCLSLCLTQSVPNKTSQQSFRSEIVDEIISLQGHLLDSGMMNRVLDTITDAGGSFEIPQFQAGLRRDQESLAKIHVFAPNTERLTALMAQLKTLGISVG